jgi:RimJ/RimL family protein N-acetyltransferase
MRLLPTLYTARLVLRPFELTDAPLVQLLAGAKQVADTTQHIPHPYEDGMAEAWIASRGDSFASGETATFAITFRSDELVGAVALALHPADQRAELGYWIGVPYWGRGYATEAAAACVAFGFEQLDLHRIHASHLVRNPASGRVMQHLGMQYEGTQLHHVLKNGVFEDLAIYGIVRP